MNLNRVVEILTDMGYTILDKDALYLKIQEDPRITDEIFEYGTSREVAEMIDEQPGPYRAAGVL
jgi:hypothetical protein